MKVKAIKAHYYGPEYKSIGATYMADKVHGEASVRNGLCKKVVVKKPLKDKK